MADGLPRTREQFRAMQGSNPRMKALIGDVGDSGDLNDLFLAGEAMYEGYDLDKIEPETEMHNNVTMIGALSQALGAALQIIEDLDVAIARDLIEICAGCYQRNASGFMHSHESFPGNKLCETCANAGVLWPKEGR